MKKIAIDASLSGTGIRDNINGGYLKPKELELNQEIENELFNWLNDYAEAFYGGYKEKNKIQELDEKGVLIARKISAFKSEYEVTYFSDALLKNISIKE
jgi:hypothetical protein